ncbi:hypothetical protein CSUB_C0757 [Candidatus Caldarchaeum subterraneum]|uniref:Uncharacterized protein n=1 Tax=Caldiarchaeum subterraneum TaxID=311458 RepID=E6N605_CALS0|nr:hypothetical protein HGMM_F13A09C07 [Candidatus Caldarchaeum subterraneum]BAJ49430.1 hypothetical protein HGMM_F15D08C21 [Candidatus Caldarchaeum subterraneum]BAJ50615.1 hypothetical protein CSUB_C0757 [Candidatus Caldarchaeum subterraneum]
MNYSTTVFLNIPHRFLDQSLVSREEARNFLKTSFRDFPMAKTEDILLYNWALRIILKKISASFLL